MRPDMTVSTLRSNKTQQFVELEIFLWPFPAIAVGYVDDGYTYHHSEEQGGAEQ